MTLWQDPPPQTRRQAREMERSGAQGETVGTSRRAGTTEPTPGGQIPNVVTPLTIADQAVAAPAAEPAAEPMVHLPESPDSPGERTLTRRELRAILQAEQANQSAGDRGESPTTAFPAQADEPNTVAMPKIVPQAAPQRPDVPASAFVAPTFTSGASATSAPSAGAASAPIAPSAPVPTAAPSAFATPDSTDPSGAPDSTPSPRYSPPTGHWSSALDDDNQPFDQIISRSVGSSGAATTTNALILPSIPVGDATGPLLSTGEIMVTGSIDLPRGLGATGQHPDRFDSSDIDRMFDSDEDAFSTSDVAPIRASRAVSTHTSTRGVITPPKRTGNRLPLILSITAAVLAVGVVALLIAGYVLKVF